jgi:hypothetical protein
VRCGGNRGRRTACFGTIEQVATQEGQLHFDGLFVTFHERLVVPAREANELVTRSPLRSTGGGSDGRHVVVIVGEHEQGALDSGGEATGPVEADAQR